MHMSDLEIAKTYINQKCKYMTELDNERINIINKVIENINNGKKMQSLLLPTGYGKTRIATIIASIYAYTGKKVLFITNRLNQYEQFKQQSSPLIDDEKIFNNLDFCVIDNICEVKDNHYFLIITDDIRFNYDDSILNDFANQVDKFEIAPNHMQRGLSTAEKQLLCEKTLKEIMIRDKSFNIDFDIRKLKGMNYIPIISSEDIYIYSTDNAIAALPITSEYNALLNKKIDCISNSKSSTSTIDFNQYFDYFDQKFDSIFGILAEHSKKLDEIADIVRKTNDIIRTNMNDIKNMVKLFENVHPQQDYEAEEFIKLALESFENKMIDSINQIQGNQRYIRCSNILKVNIGEESWDKMDEVSKKFIISAKVFFEDSIDLGDSIDYSSICVQASKAFEIEMAKRLVTQYIDYLNRESIPTSQWPTSLFNRKNNTQVLTTKEFTLGSCPYIIGLYGAPNEKATAKSMFKKYCEDELLINTSDAEINTASTTICTYVETIRDKYRNPAAHKETMTLKDAYECLQYIIDVEKALKNTLALFK